jgi:hypothetical protein
MGPIGDFVCNACNDYYARLAQPRACGGCNWRPKTEAEIVGMIDEGHRPSCAGVVSKRQAGR